jgi:hypothetical protein
MLAIITKYHGPTNFRGSRISATVRDGSNWKRRVSVPYPYEVSPTGDATHRVAAVAMCEKLLAEGFTYTKPENLISGYNNGEYVFVFTPQT